MILLLAIIALFAPRLALVLVWFLSPLVNQAFGTLFIPLLGFIFLPLTTLVYSLAYVPAQGAPTTLGWLLVILAAIVDLTAYGGTVYGRQGTSRSREQEYRRAA